MLADAIRFMAVVDEMNACMNPISVDGAKLSVKCYRIFLKCLIIGLEEHSAAKGTMQRVTD